MPCGDSSVWSIGVPDDALNILIIIVFIYRLDPSWMASRDVRKGRRPPECDPMRRTEPIEGIGSVDE